MWPDHFCAVHSPQHEVQCVRFNDGCVMWTSEWVSRIKPCTHSHSHTHTHTHTALSYIPREPQTATKERMRERWWEKRAVKRVAPLFIKWKKMTHWAIFTFTSQRDAEMRRTSSHSTICHLGFEWAGPAEQDMLIKIHFQPFFMGFWIKEAFRHVASLCCKKKQPTLFCITYISCIKPQQ